MWNFAAHAPRAHREKSLFFWQWASKNISDQHSDVPNFENEKKHSQEAEAAGGGGPAWQYGLPYFDTASRRWICPDQDEARPIKPSPPEAETLESDLGSDQEDENRLAKVTV